MKTVIAVGTYDVLHLNHLRLLEYAKSLGEYLIVAIDSDRRVRERKGDGRPVNSASSRIEFLCGFKCVDGVFVFDSDEELCKIIQSLKPAPIMVIGDEYKGKHIVGVDLVKEVVFFDLPRRTSTTEIIANGKD